MKKKATAPKPLTLSLILTPDESYPALTIIHRIKRQTGKTLFQANEIFNQALVSGQICEAGKMGLDMLTSFYKLRL
jgi:hypothetical protein